MLNQNPLPYLLRTFVSKNLVMTTQTIHIDYSSWENIQPLFDEILNQPIHNYEDFIQFIYNYNQLFTEISEEAGWRYINMTCHTNDEQKKQSYLDFITNIEPHLQIAQNQIHRKVFQSPYFQSLNNEFIIYKKNIQKDIELFREENVALQTQIQQLQQQYAEISGKQTITYENKTLTLQQASVYLKSTDRNIRENIYYLINNRRLQDENDLNQLLTQLIELRHKVALNAGFSNYRDYMHKALGRYDYTIQDCKTFHHSIETTLIPIIEKIHTIRKEKLKLNNDYRPWDTQVDMYEKDALKPFSDEDEFIHKSIQCFSEIDDYFGKCLNEMNEKKHLDLFSRIGKAPGGYQYPLYKSKVPFIFMNAVGLLRDLVTLMHEGGHAVHFFLNNHYPVLDFKSPPSEVAELASMSMELITMEHWNIFFKDKNELKRAKQQQLEDILNALPWIAAIDKFQHLLYENPHHSIHDRYTYWIDTYNALSPQNINTQGLEKYQQIRWQAQLHIYEVPFYYIEYGFAQLGAIAMWKNYKQNPKKTIENYKNALFLGNTKSIPEIYETAGIKFDFSQTYIQELIDFVWKEYEQTLL